MLDITENHPQITQMEGIIGGILSNVLMFFQSVICGSNQQFSLFGIKS